MSTLFRRKGSRFVWVGYTDQYGTRHTESTKIPFDVRSGRWIIPNAAREIQRKIDRDVADGIWGLAPKRKTPRLSEVLDLYLRSAGSNLRPNSRRGKVHAVRRLIEFTGDVPVASVDRETLFAWKAEIQKRKISAHTAANWIREISPLFRWALEEGYLDRSPIVRGLKMNPPVRPPAIYTDEEFARVLKAARVRPYLHNALRFLWETGFRVGEMMNLRWSRPATSSDHWGYTDFEKNIIWVWNEKERRYDAYPMKGVREFLEGLPRRGDWVFPASKGERLEPARFGRELRSITRDLGLAPDLTVHSIRKSYCSRLIREGVDLGTVQRLMRHRDSQTTMRYYALFQLSTLEAGQSKGSMGATIPLQSTVEGKKTA